MTSTSEATEKTTQWPGLARYPRCARWLTLCREKHPLDEPERAGGDDDDRAGEHHALAEGFAAGPHGIQQPRDDDDDQQLTDFEPGVERQQRPAERAARQVHLVQRRREAEA